jgi:hypothetical protein
MNAETNTTPENQQLSDEQIQTLLEGQLKFYKERIEFLEIQLKYETLLAEVEEQQLRQLVAKVRQAQIMSPQEEMPSEPSEGKKPRSLRKD